MIGAYEDLSPDALAPLGFHDPVRACRLLQDMAGHDVPDSAYNAALRALLPALQDCADPDRAVANLSRWAESVGSRAGAYALLAASPAATGILVTVMAASQFFADLLIQNPEYLEALTNPRMRDRPRPPAALWDDLTRRVAIAKTPNARRDALRRFKAPEVLRIGVRDLLGLADLTETVSDISAFADACVRMAWQISAQERGDAAPSQFAVIAMGKLGGQELNYSSDIDLLYVHGDGENAAEAIKLGEAVRDTLARATDAGFVFRVDLRLRPEGRFGALSRSLSSCRDYYESWAEPWERQALLKARPVAGDAALGAAFMEMAQAFVYRPRVEERFIESIRQNKRRLEQKIAHAGEADVNVKEGVGGIRDIEFAVQLMQLITGGANPAVRTGNTLDALDKLASVGLLTEGERNALREAYCFLRTVEHRLQLLDERAVRCLPRAPLAREQLARRMGYPDGRAFDGDYARYSRQAHALFERLFYGASAPQEHAPDAVGEWLLAPDDPAAQMALRARLTESGFHDTDAALALLRRAAFGSEYGGIPPPARAALARLLGPLLSAAGATDNSDAALRGLDALADALPSRAALYATLSDSPRLLPRLCLLAGNAPALWQTLLRHLEWLDALADEERMDTPPVFAPISDVSALASALLRARLMIGARDVWGLADGPQVLRETTQTAQFALTSAFALARNELKFTGRFAIIGLGKLGGEEMGYASDLDVLFVGEQGALAAAARVAERIQQVLQSGMARFGVSVDTDPRLRPEGRKGALALDLDAYRAYYETAATWERQALLKARPVAGDGDLGAAFLAMTQEIVYAHAATSDELADVRAMKRRTERERVKNAHDLKLAPGGMADIEWTVQLLQMRHGARRPHLRVPGTLDALRALRDDALLTQADWEVLAHSYLRLASLRNRLFLASGVANDAPPSLPPELEDAMPAARAVVRRVFWEET